MALTNFKLVFNSGNSKQFLFQNTNNISHLKITNSDQSYYQTLEATIEDLTSTQEDNLSINTPIKVFINNSLEFDGYVNRISKSLSGKRVYDIQSVGKTYDLWRFVTSSNTKYEGAYTSYIVSSLTKTFCSGNGTYVKPPNISPSQTGIWIDEVQFSNMTVGDCIGRMAQMDGWAFYVDNNGQLQYYQPSPSSQFTVTENQILDMSPIETSDDSLRNDILVIGSEQYETHSLQLSAPTEYIMMSTAGTYVAQRIRVPNGLDNNWLSSVKIYADRSFGDRLPYLLQGDLRKDTSSSLPSSNSTKSSATDLDAVPPIICILTNNFEII